LALTIIVLTAAAVRSAAHAAARVLFMGIAVYANRIAGCILAPTEAP
jgi:hypothetical protein